MDDLISRQAAIDALDFEIVHMTAYCDGKNEGNPLAQYNKGLEDGKKAIEALPSAQPEQRWIPCSERLPEERGFYLTTTKDKAVYCDYWNEDNFDRTEMVIAWMPLPEPYKTESEDKE